MGGNFTNVNGNNYNYIAIFNTITGWSNPFGTGLNGVCYALCIVGTNLYVGGIFSSVNGNSWNNLAKFDTTQNTSAGWSNPFGTGITGGISTGQCSALCAVGTNLYIGGNFSTVNTTNSWNNIAMFDTTQTTSAGWSNPFGTGVGPAVTNQCLALCAIGTNLYVGGIFNLPSKNIAKYDTTNGTSAGWSNPFGTGVNTGCYTLAAIGTNLYVGGRFTTVDVNSWNNIAKFDSTQTTAAGWSNPFGTGLNSYCWALNAIGTNLYVGGQFTTVNTSNNWNYIAKFDSTQSTAAGWSNPFGTGLNNICYAINNGGNVLYIGGQFTLANGISNNYITSLTNVSASLSIGYQCGYSNQGGYTIALGYKSGNVNQGNYTVAIGTNSGVINQQTTSIGIGYYSGYNNQGSSAIAIGNTSGYNLQNSYALAYGNQAGYWNQGIGAIAIGNNSGYTGQGSGAIAIGDNAGYCGQGVQAIAIGESAGATGQATKGVAIGYYAGTTGQQTLSVSIGSQAGTLFQGTGAVAIGNNSGLTSQGSYAVAIGANAGQGNQAANSIVISALGATPVNNTTANSCVINPIRSDNSQTASTRMHWNTSTGEVSYGNESSSIKYKQDIVHLSDKFVSVFETLEPKHFTFKATGQPGVGFIAEEVEEAGLHEFVTRDPISGEITGLVYEHMVAPLLKLIRKYKETIEQHESRIAILESRVKTLMSGVSPPEQL